MSGAGDSWAGVDAALAARIEAGFGPPGPWAERIAAALDACLGFLAADPERARLYMEGRYMSADGRRPGESAFDLLAELIDSGRLEAADPDRLPRPLADGIAGGIWHRVHEVIRAGRAAELPAELPDLMYFVVLPYLGREAARRERRHLR